MWVDCFSALHVFSVNNTLSLVCAICTMIVTITEKGQRFLKVLVIHRKYGIYTAPISAFKTGGLVRYPITRRTWHWNKYFVQIQWPSSCVSAIHIISLNFEWSAMLSYNNTRLSYSDNLSFCHRLVHVVYIEQENTGKSCLDKMTLERITRIWSSRIFLTYQILISYTIELYSLFIII